MSKIARAEDDKAIPNNIAMRERKSFDQQEQSAPTKIELKNIIEGNNFEMRGTIIDVFNINPIFYSCPICRAKVEKTDAGFTCKQHGQAKQADMGMIITGVVDDGSGTIRAVFFRDKARDISDIDPKTLESLSQEEAIKMIKENVLGREYIFKGRIQKNKIFDSLEFVVDAVKDVDILEESNMLLDELK
jgi:hypothetical protein